MTDTSTDLAHDEKRDVSHTEHLNNSHTPDRVYKERFWVLFMFSLCTCINACGWICFSPVFSLVEFVSKAIYSWTYLTNLLNRCMTLDYLRSTISQWASWCSSFPWTSPPSSRLTSTASALALWLESSALQLGFGYAVSSSRASGSSSLARLWLLLPSLSSTTLLLWWPQIGSHTKNDLCQRWLGLHPTYLA